MGNPWRSNFARNVTKKTEFASRCTAFIRIQFGFTSTTATCLRNIR